MVARGLEGVVAGTTRLSSIIDGTLAYGGIEIDELAAEASYEEVVYLLYYGELPTRAQLAGLQQQLAAHRALPDGVVQLLARAPRAVPMDLLRTAVSALAWYEEDRIPSRGRLLLLRGCVWWRRCQRLWPRLLVCVAASSRWCHQLTN